MVSNRIGFSPIKMLLFIIDKQPSIHNSRLRSKWDMTVREISPPASCKTRTHSAGAAGSRPGWMMTGTPRLVCTEAAARRLCRSQAAENGKNVACYLGITPQIAKTLGLTYIRHRSDTKKCVGLVINRCWSEGAGYHGLLVGWLIILGQYSV